MLEKIKTIAADTKASLDEKDAKLRKAIREPRLQFDDLTAEERSDVLTDGLANITSSSEWASAVQTIGVSLAAIDPWLREAVLYNRLDAMFEEKHGDWYAGSAIADFARSTVSLPGDEQISLLSRAARIKAEHVFFTAMLALSENWPGGVTAFEAAFSKLPTPAKGFTEMQHNAHAVMSHLVTLRS